MFMFQQTRESWQVVFFITAGVFTLGGVVYCVLGSGVIQPWAQEHRPSIVDVPLRQMDDMQTPATSVGSADKHGIVANE